MSTRKYCKRSRSSRASTCVPAKAPFPTNGELLRRAILWAFGKDIFARLPRHGNTSWEFTHLVSLVILWVWSDQAKLTAAFVEARGLSRALFGQIALHSYQGMMEALVNHSGRIFPILWEHLQHLMEQVAPAHWRVGKWLPLACDGSRFSTPRTLENERAFGLKNFGQGRMTKSRQKWKNKKRRSKPLQAATKPQIWLTLILHMGLKMPWCWKSGAASDSERAHLGALLETQKFPKNTLFCADAGFTGYELWNLILQKGHQFLIRVGSNVHLLSKLSTCRTKNGLVYLWPKVVASRKQPPLVLRLIKLESAEGTMFLITSVLNERELSNSMAEKLYRLRWGIELQVRSVKQTFGCRKLRSRTPGNALVELEWALAGLWLIQLLAVKEQIIMEGTPQRSSVALALHAVRTTMRAWSERASREQTLAHQLRNAVQDNYERHSSKCARYSPNYKDKPTRSGPKIRLASETQKHAYKRLLYTT